MKAVLITDMPMSCEECVCSEQDDFILCRMSHYAIGSRINRPRWCPLRPLPQKRNRTGAYDFGSAKEDDGWNSYYDELMGEHERDEPVL